MITLTDVLVLKGVIPKVGVGYYRNEIERTGSSKFQLLIKNHH